MAQLITSMVGFLSLYSLYCMNLHEPCAICCLHFHPIIWSSDEADNHVIQTDILLFHNSISISLQGKGKQNRLKKGMKYIFVYVCATRSRPSTSA